MTVRANITKVIHDPKEFGRVAVLLGGTAAERDISLKSGQAVLEALLSNGIDAAAVDMRDVSITELAAAGYDRLFNMLHGRGGEDGTIQGALETLGLPYTGSGLLGSALSMDKLRSKLCWMGCGLPTPRWIQLRERADLALCEEQLGYPVIVKPASEGSSIGMSRAENRQQMEAAWELASGCDCEVFAEQWVSGKEYTCAVLKGVPLPMIRLETPNSFYDYEAKYLSETTLYHCPCGLSPERERAFQQLALEACEILSVSGWGRVDLMVDEDSNPWLIEVNTIPGMTDHSLVPMAAKAAGLSFEELVWRVLETSFEHEKANG